MTHEGNSCIKFEAVKTTSNIKHDAKILATLHASFVYHWNLGFYLDEQIKNFILLVNYVNHASHKI